MRIALFPAEASTFAPHSDALFYALLIITGTIAAVVAIIIVTFAIKYRAGSKVNREFSRRPRIDIEVTWIVLPLLILIAVFFWSSDVFSTLYKPPQQMVSIYVIGKQWMWKIEHQNGTREINQLHVPLGMPIQLILTSQDVIHSFYVPAFRIKQDVLPGRYTNLWFTATQIGNFSLFCAEFCGTDHAQMGGNVIVLAPAEYGKWLNRSGANLNLSQRGFELFKQHGCNECHDRQSTVRAPLLNNIYGSEVKLDNGESVIADETYLRDSMLVPNKQVVADYKPIMPSFKDQLNEEEIVALIAYMKETTQP